MVSGPYDTQSVLRLMLDKYLPFEHLLELIYRQKGERIFYHCAQLSILVI